MPNLNKLEYGATIHANMNEDVSAFTALNFVIEPRIGAKLEKTVSDGVVLGQTNITVDDEQYLANQYISYTIKENDLSISGQWRYRGEATMSATNKVIGDFKRFTVLD